MINVFGSIDIARPTSLLEASLSHLVRCNESIHPPRYETDRSFGPSAPGWSWLQTHPGAIRRIVNPTTH